MSERETKYCQECGEEINAKAEICPECGVRQADAVGRGPGGSGVNRIAAALLALFLGGIGAHKFYLGKVGQGLLYLLFFWTFIPGIIALVEFIIYLTQSDEEFQRQYG